MLLPETTTRGPLVTTGLELGQRSGGCPGDDPAAKPLAIRADDAATRCRKLRGTAPAHRRTDHRYGHHAPAANVVAEVAESHQREQRADDIGSEDHGHPERTEAHLPLIQHIQRNRQRSAHHQSDQHPSRQDVAAALSEIGIAVLVYRWWRSWATPKKACRCSLLSVPDQKHNVGGRPVVGQ